MICASEAMTPAEAVGGKKGTIMRGRYTFHMLLVTASAALGLAACGSTAATTANQQSTAVVQATAAPAVQATAASEPAPAAASTTTSAAAEATGSNTKLNLNTVTEDQLLATIPDFSNRMVHEFMEYRPYVSIQQFRKEIGKYVSADQVTTWEQYVYVPIDVDNADAATLQQIPGVDATIAEALTAGRPYGSTEAFLTKLGEYLTEAQVQQAQSYLAS